MKTSTPNAPLPEPRSLLPLRLTFVAVPVLAGLDKFVGILADWEAYLAPALRDLLPMSPATFLAIAGLVEIAVGLAMATRFVKLAAFVASGWLAAIALQLILAGYLDVAVRDLVMAVAAWTLGRLSPAPATRGSDRPVAIEARA